MNRWMEKLTFWRIMFIVILATGMVAGFRRFYLGLGPTTGLSDQVPWGMWIGFDVMSGVALAAGGFTLSALVYIFNLKQFHAVVRPAILTAFLGYILVAVGLLFDLGRPWFIWHPIFFRNPNSVMLEVAWCVMLYLTVLAFEFVPAFFERLGWGKAVKVMKIGTPILVILGVLLSSLHQSSLGSLFLIVPNKLHPLWYSTRLPYLFFVSAMSVGFAMVIVESYLSNRAFRKELERPIITDLGRAMMVVLIFLAVLRGQDLIGRGSLPYMFQATTEAALFWLEIGLGIIIPIIMVAIPKVRLHPQGMFYAALATALGVILNRMNVAITGMAAKLGSYFPSWEELSISIMLVALGFAAFAWAVKNLPVFGPSPWTGTVVVTPAIETERVARRAELQPARM